jgi:hypothetical protein
MAEAFSESRVAGIGRDQNTTPILQAALDGYSGVCSALFRSLWPWQQFFSLCAATLAWPGRTATRVLFNAIDRQRYDRHVLSVKFMNYTKRMFCRTFDLTAS